MKPATSRETAEFELAGPVNSSVDVDALVKSRALAGAYRVVGDDVLEFQMPEVLRGAEIAPAGPGGATAYSCRVNESGMALLPMLGEVKLAGKTLGDIENELRDAYHPKYLSRRPSIVVRVAEYHVSAVSVVGAVKEPGVYRLRSDEMTVVSLLMKSGGILPEGASAIRIRKGEAPGGEVRTLVLPVKGLNIPFEDVALSGGEVVEVESLPPQVFSVMGLVNKPGSFAFPPNGKFNLTTALALAGGLDEAAGPRYARVYRQDKNGKVVSALFMVDDDHLAVAANVFLKPGDIVAVEQTSETKFRKAMSKIGTGLGGAVSYSLQ